jgi:hypothetical protein
VGSYTGIFGAGLDKTTVSRLTLVERWDGSAWAIQPPPPSYFPSLYGADTALTGASCTAPTTCMAVGGYGDTMGWNAALWDGTSWSTQTPPSPPVSNTALAGVSCTSPSACTAIGSYYGGHGTGVVVDRWDGTSWSIQPTPGPVATGNLAGVSCAAATACTAVGSSVPAAGATATLVERWDGIAWSVQPSPAEATATTSLVSLTDGEAVLAATGTTGSLDTSLYFQYALTSDRFCSSEGATGTPSSTPAQIIPGASTPFDVSATVADLSRGSTYCFRFVATNAVGTSYSAIGVFPFFIAPQPSGMSVTTTGARAATVTGSVLPELLATSVEVDYDLVASPFCTHRRPDLASGRTTPATLPADLMLHNVSLSLSGLRPGRRYCAAIVARNEGGQSSTSLSTFTAGSPVVGPVSVAAIAGTAATIMGSIDPVAQPTRYHVAYDTGRSRWCRDHGSGGAAAFSTRPRTLRFKDLGQHNVIMRIHGLRPLRSYCLALVARNRSGTTVAAAPPLPAAPTLTVAIPTPPGTAAAGTVTSSPNGISCPGRCSASFARGIPVTLLATPDAGRSFTIWNPSQSCEGYPCPSAPMQACANLSAPTCPITLSQSTTVTAVFGTQSSRRLSCVLASDGRKVRSLTLSVSATCTAPVNVTITGRLRELTRTAKMRTFALHPIRPTGPRTSWQLRMKLPRFAINALRAGARESLSLTLTYYNPHGRGRTTLTIRHLTP